MISRLAKTGRDVKIIKRTEQEKWTRKNNIHIEALMFSVFLYMAKTVTWWQHSLYLYH